MVVVVVGSNEKPLCWCQTSPVYKKSCQVPRGPVAEVSTMRSEGAKATVADLFTDAGQISVNHRPAQRMVGRVFDLGSSLGQNGNAFWLMKCVKETKPAFHRFQARSKSL